MRIAFPWKCLGLGLGAFGLSATGVVLLRQVHRSTSSAVQASQEATIQLELLEASGRHDRELARLNEKLDRLLSRDGLHASRTAEVPSLQEIDDDLLRQHLNVTLERAREQEATVTELRQALLAQQRLYDERIRGLEGALKRQSVLGEALQDELAEGRVRELALERHATDEERWMEFVESILVTKCGSEDTVSWSRALCRERIATTLDTEVRVAWSTCGGTASLERTRTIDEDLPTNWIHLPSRSLGVQSDYLILCDPSLPNGYGFRD